MPSNDHEQISEDRPGGSLAGSRTRHTASRGGALESGAQDVQASSPAHLSEEDDLTPVDPGYTPPRDALEFDDSEEGDDEDEDKEWREPSRVAGVKDGEDEGLEAYTELYLRLHEEGFNPKAPTWQQWWNRRQRFVAPKDWSRLRRHKVEFRSHDDLEHMMRLNGGLGPEYLEHELETLEASDHLAAKTSGWRIQTPGVTGEPVGRPVRGITDADEITQELLRAEEEIFYEDIEERIDLYGDGWHPEDDPEDGLFLVYVRTGKRPKMKKRDRLRRNGRILVKADDVNVTALAESSGIPLSTLKRWKKNGQKMSPVVTKDEETPMATQLDALRQENRQEHEKTRSELHSLGHDIFRALIALKDSPADEWQVYFDEQEKTQ